ncbi:bifunctional proline dehydrogenase/L-glutamate gamma-semialdehyde dehydrogenase [Sulfurimonas sp.]|uniref:bifunctional proline dehydrogenase/L-glutamate gamma-semialdehyde dehydrogenase n=1 Tax=Sulfurimonas sp. TaxID=2022749 RepID=UPI0035687E54
MSISNKQFSNAQEIAKEWQKQISKSRVKSEKKFHKVMSRLLQDPLNKVFLIELLDQSFRSNNPHRIANQLEYLFEKYSDTSFFGDFEKVLVWLFRHIGVYMPAVSVPIFIRYLRNDISDVVIKGEDEYLNKHLKKRKKEGTRVNINIIGEMVLGEKEAAKRIEKYKRALSNPEIDYISIKISTIFSQINPLAHEWSVNKLTSSLELIYDEAIKNRHKFVNLDMEEYKDLHLSIDVFKEVLSKEKYLSLYAGIAIQTYMPDAFEIVKQLSIWAKKRVESGGSPIKIRIVKGANQEMEQTEASLRGWRCVTYDKKAQSDANYKLIIDYLLRTDIAPYVHTGLASHNLFDQALGMLLSRERSLEQYYSTEMLEGMSETAYRMLKNESLNVVLYAPIATAKTFTNAIAYLVRRFDENTADRNYMRHSFGLEVDTPEWEILVESYKNSIEIIDSIALTPYRTQNRNSEKFIGESENEVYEFKNEPDTDFALEKNIMWAEKIAKKWKYVGEDGGYHASSVIGGKTLEYGDIVEVIDKSQYHESVVVGRYKKADANDMKRAVEVAKEDIDGWRQTSINHRQKILMSVANEFKKDRADLIGIAAAEVGKVFTETDVEISEAIDFLNFYPYSVQKISNLEGVELSAKGVGLVVSPWNFPIAIPAGGVAAALASGNTVILKPASASALCAHRLCECFWRGGVSKNTLQLVITDGGLAGEYLVSNPDIDFVIFTGGEITAHEMLRINPSLHLSAETGGKNATIVTSLADRDQAVKNVVQSAFNNSGQKCSATSLLILEKELYVDREFRAILLDATKSLEVGSVWDFKNRVGTLSSKVGGNLAKSLEHLSEDEEWLLEPSYVGDNPYLLKPSIKLGTKPGSFSHLNELFGPVLSVMSADNLYDAIEIVNSTGYGLTSAIETLDEREQKIWKEKIKAGNLYINRGTTGAIVTRQPFGGMGKSAIGSGKKAGGFNYVAQFMNITHDITPITQKETHPILQKLEQIINEEEEYKNTLESVYKTAQGFAYWIENEFAKEHDYTNVRGESNIIRYLSVQNVLLRFENNDSLYEMVSSICAVKMSGAKLQLSIADDMRTEVTEWIKKHIDVLIEDNDIVSFEDQERLVEHIKTTKRVRFLKPSSVQENIYEKIVAEAIHIASEPFISHGRIELMHYYIEQSISHSYHRYGNLGARGL